jgi:hypothetical protein
MLNTQGEPRDGQQVYLPLARIGATTLNKVGLDGADAKYIHAKLDFIRGTEKA